LDPVHSVEYKYQHRDSHIDTNAEKT